MNQDRPIRRVKRAKGRGPGDGHGLDGGAVAAGLLVPIAAVFVVIAGPMPHWARFLLLALAVAIGGLVAGALTPGKRGLVVVHGLLVAVGTVGLMAVAAISVDLGAGERTRLPVVVLREAGWGHLGGGLAAAMLLAVGFAWLGRRLRRRARAAE